MIQLCRRIFRDNRQCGQPAVNGTFYCRHHRDVKDWKRRSGLRSQFRTQTYDHGTILVPEARTQTNPDVELEFPEDPAAILTNIFRVTSLLVQGEIDRPTANSVTYGMQVCLSALNGKPLFEPATSTSTRSRSRSHDITLDESSEAPDSETTYHDPSNPPALISRPVHRVILTPDGDEIAPPVEILEDNEAEPIHHKGCPCMSCAEKYRNHPPEEHHPDCTCGLCEEPEQSAEHSAQSTEPPINDVILSEARTACEVEGPASKDQDQVRAESKDLLLANTGANMGAPSFATRRAGSESANFMICHPERSEAESRDLLLADCGTNMGAPSFRAFGERVGSDSLDEPTLHPTPYPLHPRSKRVARAASLLSGSTTRDPLNRPWSVAEYTFGDAIRRHEAQYAARAAAALAVGIEPPPYEPFTTGMIPPGHPDYEEDQQMQQHSSEYWAAHFRKQIAERPDIQQYLDEEEQQARGSATNGDNPEPETGTDYFGASFG